MTDAEFLAWLKDPSAIRIVLIEAVAQVDGVETTFYMSAGSTYNTSAADTPPNEVYQGIASVGVLFTERLSLDNRSASLAAGDIQIENFNGDRDGWMNYAWMNRSVKAWVGDPRWPRADFRMVFNGLAADIGPSGRNYLSLRLRDKMQRLNTPISDAKLGGSGPNKDALKPLTFGQVHNMTPLLVDEATLQYQVHNGAIEDLIEVRNNGVVVASLTKSNSTGTFTLGVQPFGAVTCSVEGDKPSTYSYTVANLVKRIVKSYGKTSGQLVDADIDLTNFAAFEAANTQYVGITVSDRENVLSVCHEIASSVGAQLSFSRLGLLRLLKVEIPGTGTPVVVRPQHIVEGSLVPVQRTEVIGAVRLGYCKNWTVDESVVTDIPEEHKSLYAQEWLTVTKEDATAQTKYKLDGDTVQQDTMLLTTAHAEAEAQRRLDLWKVPRTVYEFEGTPELMTAELGQAITVYSSRFGMSAGVTGQIVSLAPDWRNAHVKVGFIV